MVADGRHLRYRNIPTLVLWRTESSSMDPDDDSRADRLFFPSACSVCEPSADTKYLYTRMRQGLENIGI